jgi:DNA recombination protein RmuC
LSTETIALVIAFASVIAVGALVVYVVRLSSAAGTGSDTDIVARLDGFTAKFTQDQGAVSEKFEQLDKKLASVQTAVDKSEGSIDEQMGRIGDQVTGIVSLFSNDRQRGNWGELSLERIFEVAGLVEGRDYQSQFSDGEGRPDVVVFLPGDQTIVIDSKFPVARYLEAMTEEDVDTREALMLAHGKELETVGKSLVKKHYANNASAGYVIVFLPSQAVYESAAAAHPDVVERLMQQSVIVAGPVNVFALIKTAGSLMAEHRAVKDAREIVGQVRDLRSRLGVFAGHLEKVGRGLNSASAAFNKAIGSWNSKLRPSVNRIAEMSGTDQLAYLEEANEAIGATAPNDLKEAV